MVRCHYWKVCVDHENVAMRPGFEEVECQICVCFQKCLKGMHTLSAHSVLAHGRVSGDVFNGSKSASFPLTGVDTANLI